MKTRLVVIASMTVIFLFWLMMTGEASDGLTITEFPLPTPESGPAFITAGPDKNLWFTEEGNNKIGRITIAGVITEFPVPTANSKLGGITAGSDGNLWFTEYNGNKIGRITTTGVVTEFRIPTAKSGSVYITAGPDDNVWFTESEANKIGRITPAGVITEFRIPTADVARGIEPMGITAGPDGNLWFIEGLSNKIGRISPAGVIKEFRIPTDYSDSSDITAGPDGNLWFTEGKKKIGRITVAGVITEFPVSGDARVECGPVAITAGPDGNLWFADNCTNNIWRITTAGVATRFPIPSPGAPSGIAVGPDGNIWFTAANKIGRVNLISQPTPTPKPPTPTPDARTAAEKDDSLVEAALDTLEESQAGENIAIQLRQQLEEQRLRILFGPMPEDKAGREAYTESKLVKIGRLTLGKNAITIDQKYRSSPPPVIAAILAHEGTHATWPFWKRPIGKDSSIDEEYEASVNQVDVWREVKGQYKNKYHDDAQTWLEKGEDAARKIMKEKMYPDLPNHWWCPAILGGIC